MGNRIQRLLTEQAIGHGLPAASKVLVDTAHRLAVRRCAPECTVTRQAAVTKDTQRRLDASPCKAGVAFLTPCAWLPAPNFLFHRSPRQAGVTQTHAAMRAKKRPSQWPWDLTAAGGATPNSTNLTSRRGSLACRAACIGVKPSNSECRPGSAPDANKPPKR